MTDSALSEIKLPQPLAPGDRIAVAAPAGPFDMEKFEAGLAVLRKWGLEPVLGRHVTARRGFLAGEDRQRAADMKAFLEDPELKAVICARGGYGCLRLLPLMEAVDLDGPAKWLIGFSDVTALHHYLYNRVGWVTLHGPMVTTLAAADAVSRDHLWSLLSGAAAALRPYSLGEALLPGVATGRMAGGNLATLSHLLGTPYQPDFSGCLLFLEEVGEAPYRIDRMLTQMGLAGCFDGLAGLVVGQFTDCGSWEEIRAIIVERLTPYGIPAAAGLTAGHGAPNLALPLGATATLYVEAQSLIYNQPFMEVP
jgi:muramoyltetrapeptide carboxypeptidase